MKEFERDLPEPVSAGKTLAVQDLKERGQTIQTHKTHHQKEEKTGREELSVCTSEPERGRFML